MAPQALALTLHAFASLGHTPHELLDVAAEQMAARLPDYPPQSLAMAVWAFATYGLHPGRGLPFGGPTVPALGGAPLMVAAGELAAQRTAGFSLQGLSMLLWGFASLEQAPPRALLEAACERLRGALAGRSGDGGGGSCKDAQGPLCAASLQAASNIAWSCARMGHADGALFEAIGISLPLLVAATCASEGEPSGDGGSAARGGGDSGGGVTQALSNLAYAAAKLRLPDERLLQGLSSAALPRVAAFHPDELCNLLWWGLRGLPAALRAIRRTRQRLPEPQPIPPSPPQGLCLAGLSAPAGAA